MQLLVSHNAYAMQIVPFGLRAVLTRDVDVRRLYWLLRTPALAQSHRSQLSSIRERYMRRTDWPQKGDRETIRVIFNLHRAKPVKVIS